MWTTKFKLLWRLNWTLIKKHLYFQAVKCLLPVIIFFIALRINKSFDQGKITEKSSFEFNINIATCTINSKNILELWYAPDNEFNRKLMNDVQINMNLKAMKDVEELTHQLMNNQTAMVAAVVFEDTASSRLKHLNYTIRMPEVTSSGTSWNTDKLYYYELSADPRPNSFPSRNLIYHSSCFSKLQNVIDQAFIKASSNGQEPEKLKTLKPFPIFTKNYGISVYLLPFAIVSSVLLLVLHLIWNIKIERKVFLTESMKLMGLSSALCWLSWFIRSFIILLISFTFIVILTYVSIFSNSNPFIVWIFFMSYITSMITFCFLVTVVFKKLSCTVIVGSIVFIATIFPYIMYHDSFFTFSYSAKVLFCMLTNTNMGQGIKMILMAEVNDGGVGFGNLFKKSVDIKFSFVELLLWMNIGSALQMLLTIYIEKVFPGEFRLSKPWYFPLKFVYRRMVKKPCNDNSHQDLEMEPLSPASDQEEVPLELLVGIELKNLSKRFGTNHAVRNLSLNLYENQITVLLGHNGAGKTTAMSMLTGSYQPTSGTVIVKGFDIRTDTDAAQKFLGVCPHHDGLFEELTVEEHLKFFCKLKGMTDKSNIQEDIIKYTKLLEISEKLTNQIKVLNAEEKRKLTMAIAFCGNSKIVILDEPTAGMDSSFRRLVWNLLIAEKKNRTILIATASVDEAEVLADRIAKMSEGQLRTVGSLSFIKKRLKVGYRLICVKKDGFQVQNVLHVIQEFASSSFIAKNEDKDAAFGLSEDYVAIFGQIFERLEAESEALRISSFGCGFVSLEDAIARLNAGTDELDIPDEESSPQKIIVDKKINKQEIPVDQTPFDIENLKDQETEKELQKHSKLFTFFQPVYAMFLKKFHIHRRSWQQFLFFGIISILAIFIVPNFVYTEYNEPSSLPISLGSYEETETLIKVDKSSAKSVKYKSLFTGKDNIVTISTDLEEEIVKKFNESIGTVNHKNLIAAIIKSDEFTAWFNSQPYHALPLTINTVNRAILKSVAGNDYEITVNNHPYLISEVDSVASSMLSFATIWILLTVWPMIYIEFYIKERQMKFKFQQLSCGTNRLVFWFTNFIFDYIFFILICSVLFGRLVWLNFEKDQRLKEFGVLMTVGSSYGFSWICFIYAFSYLFSKPSARTAMLLILSIIFGTLSIFDYEVVITTNPFLKFFAAIYHWIGMIFAPFTLVQMTQKVFSETRPFDYSILKEYIIANIVTGCIFFLIAILNGCNFFTYAYYKLKAAVPNSDKPQLHSEAAHQQTLKETQNINEEEPNIAIENLVKGFVLTIKTGFTDENKVMELKEIVVRKFLDVEFKEQQLDILTVHLKNIDLKYSEMFRSLAKIKDETSIKSYKLVQMILED